MKVFGKPRNLRSILYSHERDTHLGITEREEKNDNCSYNPGVKKAFEK